MYYLIRHDTMFKNLVAFRLMNTIRTGPRKIHLLPLGERIPCAPTWVEQLHGLLADMRRERQAGYAA